ncbi:ERAD-associated protein [Tilletia horrida]|nr:ERAD-associated protein [Tilletia horrida]
MVTETHRPATKRKKKATRSHFTSLSFTLLVLTSLLHILTASASSTPASASASSSSQDLTAHFQNTYTHSQAYNRALRLLDSLLLNPPAPPSNRHRQHGNHHPDASTPDHGPTQTRTEYHSAHWDAFSTWGPLGTILRLAVATRNTLRDWASSSKASSGTDASAFIPEARSQDYSSSSNSADGEDPLIYGTTNGSRPLQLWPWWEGRGDSAIAGPWIVPELEIEQLAGNSALSSLSSASSASTKKSASSSSSGGILAKFRGRRAARARKGTSSGTASSSGKKLTPLEKAQRRRTEAVALLEWVSFGHVEPDYEQLMHIYRQQQQQQQPSTGKQARQAQQDALNAALNRNRTHIAHRVPVRMDSFNNNDERMQEEKSRIRSAALWILAEHSLWGTHAASPHLPRAYAAYQSLATDYGNGTAHARLGFLEGSGWGRIGGPGLGSGSAATASAASDSLSAGGQSWGVGFQGTQIGEESDAEEGLRQARALLHYTIAASTPEPASSRPGSSSSPSTLPVRGANYSTQTSAQMALAYRHFSGIGTPMDCLKALPWYEAVAQDVHARYLDGPPGGLTLPYSHLRLSDVQGGAFGPGASAASSGFAAKRMHMKAVLESRAGSGAAGDEARIRDLLEYYEYQAEPILKIPSHLMSEGQRRRETARGRGRSGGKGKSPSSGAGGMLARSGLGRRLGFGGAPQGELTGMGGSTRSTAAAAMYALELARFYYGGSLWLAGESAGKVERDYERAMDYALRVAHRVWPFDADQVRRGGASGPDPRLTKKQATSSGKGASSGSRGGSGAGGIPDARDPNRRPGDPPVQQLVDFEDFKYPTKNENDLVFASRAAAMLGWMFLRGEGAPQSFHNAWVWFSRGSEAGDTDCHNGLGVMIRDGLGVKPSPKDATQYFTAAAQPVGPTPEGMTNMGRVYLGLKDYGNAARMFQNAKSLQDPFESFLWHGKIDAYITHAQEATSSSSSQPLSAHSTSGPTLQERCDSAVINLKHAIERADWADPVYHRADRAWKRGDSQRALLGWMLAGEMGYEPAQNNVAWILDRDDSFDRLALVQWTRSAGQENVDALVKMGDYYFRGIGTPTPGIPAYEKAVACYSAAADMSASALAYWNMGWMYETGLGVGGGRDFHLAKRYYDMAWATNKKEAYLAVFLSLVKLHVRAAWAAVYHRDASALAMFESYARGLDMSMPLTEAEEETMRKAGAGGDAGKKTPQQQQQQQQKKQKGSSEPEDEPGSGDMHIPETYDRRTPAERIQDPQVQRGGGAGAAHDGWLGNDDPGGFQQQQQQQRHRGRDAGAGGAEDDDDDDDVVVFELDLFEDFEGLLLLGAMGFLAFLVWYRRRIQQNVAAAGGGGGARNAAGAAAMTPEERERRERIEAARREFRARGEDVPPGPDEVVEPPPVAAAAAAEGAAVAGPAVGPDANRVDPDGDDNDGLRRRGAGVQGEAALDEDRDEADPEWFANAM